MLFVHQSITPLISNITSAAIACGMANTLGNKGGVGVSFHIGSTRIVVINTHLAANQNQTETRNLQFCKICSEIVPLLKKNLIRPSATSSNSDQMSIVEPIPSEIASENGEMVERESMIQSEPGGDEEEVANNGGVKDSFNITNKIDEYIGLCDELDRYGDRVIIMGDMNYRINGNRLTIFSFSLFFSFLFVDYFNLKLDELLISCFHFKCMKYYSQMIN